MLQAETKKDTETQGRGDTGTTLRSVSPRLRVSAFPCLFLFLLIGLLALAAPALAQSGVTGEVLSVGLGGTVDQYGTYRIGNWVPVHVRLENRTGQRVACLVGIEQPDLDGDKVTSISREIVLQPTVEPRDVWLYYWPKPNDEGRGIASLSIYDAENMRIIGSIKVPKALPQENPGIAPLSSEDSRSSRWVLVVGPRRLGFNDYRGSRGGAARVVDTSVTQASELPDQALGLDGVDVIIWQADQSGVRVSEMPEEFQLKAILDWVRAGGHLIITAGARWQETGDIKTKLSEALPMVFEGTRQASLSRLLEPHAKRLKNMTTATVPQVTGTIKPQGRDISMSGNNEMREAPLVVTGRYGTGAVTVVTIDLANPDVESVMGPENWLAFWQRVAGWGGDVVTAAQAEIMNKSGGTPITHQVNRVKLDQNISSDVDLKSVTSWRLLLAVLFLGVYWIVAGPGMDILLRRYRRSHWSWWIFGAVVVGAAAVAVLVSSLLRLENEDLRHRTFVAGTVGDNEAMVLSYMGVFAPTNDYVTLGLPESAGLSYLAPLNEPSVQDMQTFADPQSYYLPRDPRSGNDSGSTLIRVPFRSTLKKIQARWVGPLGGTFEVTSAAGIKKDRSAGEMITPLQIEGTLVNRTAYEFTHVMFVALSDDIRDYISPSSIFDLRGSWRPGQPIVLERDTTRRKPTLKEILDATVQAIPSKGPVGGYGGGFAPASPLKSNEENKADTVMPIDLLNILLDMRDGELLTENGRAEFERQLTRQFDRSAALRATRLMLIATAGGDGQNAVLPLNLRVGDKTLRGTGQVTFAYMIPVMNLSK